MTEELSVTIPMSDIQELMRLINKVGYPNVTHDKDKLVMAQQAVASASLDAEAAWAMLFKYSSYT